MKKTIAMAVVITTAFASAGAQVYGLDPRDRDESIAGTSIDVTTSLEGNVWLYRYTLTAPESNLGIVQFFRINLECDEPVDDRGFDPSLYATEPYDDLGNGESSIPAAITADYGATWGYSITVNNEVMFSVVIPPGETAGTMNIYSPYAPGKQHFILQPRFSITEKWAYPMDAELIPEIPKEDDFYVNGLITAPACPGDEQDPEPVLFDGSLPPWESEVSNKLIRYESPDRDRFVTENESLELIVHYSEEIDPKTFKVVPASGGIPSLFHPEPGTSETVIVPLKRGYTKLKVQVASLTPGPGRKGAKRDTDFFDINHIRDVKAKGSKK